MATAAVSPNPTDTPISDTRKYLEDPNHFAWKDGTTECIFSANERPPLNWVCALDQYPNGTPKSQKSFVSKYTITQTYMDFKYPFAVKEIKSLKKKQTTVNEVKIMKGLRHPHIIAFLGTFYDRDRLHILMYPAAVCDLGDLMSRISDELCGSGTRHEARSSVSSNGRISEDEQQSRRPSSSALRTSLRHSPSSSNDTTIFGENRASNILIWPLKEKMHALLGYFSCLCQALSYLHAHNVRHKDIKPGNILIDSKGYVILTDFGISEKFEDNVPHETKKEMVRTEQYQSPEKLNDLERGDPEDLWHLGCVFLEMASLGLGKDSAKIKKHFSRVVNIDGKIISYCENVSKLPHWLKELSESIQPSWFSINQRSALNTALSTIKVMLSEDPDSRPKADGTLFDRFLMPETRVCRDCDPSHPEAWKPTDLQKQDAIGARDAMGAGLEIRRRSIRSINDSSSVPTRRSPDLSTKRHKASSPSRPHSYSPSSKSYMSLDAVAEIEKLENPSLTLFPEPTKISDTDSHAMNLDVSASRAHRKLSEPSIPTAVHSNERSKSSKKRDDYLDINTSASGFSNPFHKTSVSHDQSSKEEQRVDEMEVINKKHSTLAQDFAIEGRASPIADRLSPLSPEPPSPRSKVISSNATLNGSGFSSESEIFRPINLQSPDGVITPLSTADTDSNIEKQVDRDALLNDDIDRYGKQPFQQSNSGNDQRRPGNQKVDLGLKDVTAEFMENRSSMDRSMKVLLCNVREEEVGKIELWMIAGESCSQYVVPFIDIAAY